MADIQVNGRTYRLVPFDEYTLGESQVFWDYTNMSQDQISEIEGFHPGLVAAMIHIAVQRGEPGESERQIRKVVNEIPIAKLNDVFMETYPEASDDAPLPEKSMNGSGGDSSTSSDRLPAPSTQPVTGNPGSATGAISDRRTWQT